MPTNPIETILNRNLSRVASLLLRRHGARSGFLYRARVLRLSSKQVPGNRARRRGALHALLAHGLGLQPHPHRVLAPRAGQRVAAPASSSIAACSPPSKASPSGSRSTPHDDRAGRNTRVRGGQRCSAGRESGRV